jgi:hypothetical protein
MATVSAFRTQLALMILGMVLGGMLVGVLAWGNWFPHYWEDETFFRGKIGDKEVVGISYHEFHGLGFMDTGRWKVVLGNPGDAILTLYDRERLFQESIPHQPKVEIRDGNRVLIDDGEDKLSVTVEYHTK